MDKNGIIAGEVQKTIDVRVAVRNLHGNNVGDTHAAQLCFHLLIAGAISTDRQGEDNGVTVNPHSISALVNTPARNSLDNGNTDFAKSL